jgi:thioredoxin-like negative regulator of GroEL
MISIVNIEQLDEFIINNSDKILLLYFGAKRCSPCNILKDRILYESHEKMPNLLVGYIDVDIEENNEIADIYDVKMLPTQIFVKLKKDKVKIINRIDGYDWVKLVMLYDEIAKKYCVHII